MTDVKTQYKLLSLNSPCPVANEESLLCVNYQPEKDFEESFPKSADINGEKGRTCSLNRARYSTSSQLIYIKDKQTGNGKAYDAQGNPKRTSSFIAKLTDVGHLRNFRIDGQAVLAVWDDPIAKSEFEPENPAHASVVSTVVLKRDKLSEVRIWFKKATVENPPFEEAIKEYCEPPKPRTLWSLASKMAGSFRLTIASRRQFGL